MKTLITRHECLSCGGTVVFKHDVYVCFTCEYIEDGEDFALHLESWDAQIAEAQRDAERMAVA